MKPIELFKADNFDFGSRSDNQQAADAANMYFNGWLRSAVRVYGFKSDVHGFLFSYDRNDKDTRQDLLLCVEKIKIPCEHIPKQSFHGAADCFMNECELCGIKLQPTGWKAVE